MARPMPVSDFAQWSAHWTATHSKRPTAMSKDTPIILH
jgi:hypothetical protein